jgi:hypothetical protein
VNKKIPTCLNENCGLSIKIRDRGRPQAYCGPCATAKRKTGGTRHRTIENDGEAFQELPSINPFHKNKCSNHDNHLGFTCTQYIKKRRTKIIPKDGNTWNNVPENMIEFCGECANHFRRKNE